MARSRTLLLLSVSLLLALGMLWSQGVFSAVSPPPPTVGTPVAQPSTLAVNYATLLTVTSRITTSPGNPVVPASVKLESVDANGAVLATRRCTTMAPTGIWWPAMASLPCRWA